MEKVTGGPPESPTRRAATIARVGARYGVGFVFGGRLPRRRGPADTGRLGPRRPPPPARGPAPPAASGSPSAAPLPRRRGPADTGRIGPRLRLSLEELGPTFAEFGRFLSAHGDLIPPDVAAELARAAAPATPVPFAEARAVLERALDTTLGGPFVSFGGGPVGGGPLRQAH